MPRDCGAVHSLGSCTRCRYPRAYSKCDGCGAALCCRCWDYGSSKRGFCNDCVPLIQHQEDLDAAT